MREESQSDIGTYLHTGHLLETQAVYVGESGVSIEGRHSKHSGAAKKLNGCRNLPVATLPPQLLKRLTKPQIKLLTLKCGVPKVARQTAAALLIPLPA